MKKVMSRQRAGVKHGGLLLVLSAPSGAGKTTVIHQLLRRDKRLVKSISWTTRKPRHGERNGKDYFFVSRKQFLSAIRRNGFLEWAKVYREYYGTPKSYVQDKLAHGKDVVLVIDTRGAKQVRRSRPNVLVFLKAPSLAVLKSRLKGRNSESKSQLAARIHEARYEMKQARWYDYQVVNRTVSQAVRDIKKILEKERKKIKRRK